MTVRSWLILATPLCLMPLLCLAADQAPSRRPAQPPASSSAADAAWSYFNKNCVSCHNADARAGGLDLATLRRPDSLTRSRESWESVARKIRNGEMPPKGSPRPPEAASKATVRWIEAEFDRVDKAAPTNPGRVTAHRLNRAEYNNTVRDLLGVDIRPADDFPQDDSGYGFDNIGDVLSLSTSRMEKYMAAAEKVARTAVFGPGALEPTLTRHEAPGRNIVVGTTVPARYDATGLTEPNSLHATHRFPVEGEYLFKFHFGGVRPRGSEPLRLGLWVDGRKVQSLQIDVEGASGFTFGVQDFSGRTQECRVRVPAGEHWVAATIEDLYDGLPPDYGGPNPTKKPIPPLELKLPTDIPPERAAQIRKRFAEQSKNKTPVNDVRISSLDIGGPYDPVKGPSDASLRLLYTCGHLHGGHTPACTPKIVGSLARRAFRRPATPQEITRLTGLVSLAQKQGDSYEEGLCLAIQGVLVSPQFLFRIEQDQTSAKPGAAHPISDYELASRLSYFLWSTMPDGELLACADRNALHQPAVLEAQVRRMLKDPRSRALSENFGGQWLQYRALESVKPDPARFPHFDAYLRMSMRQETELFLDSVFREDRSILDLLLGKYTFLNERLASFYGIPGVVGPAFRKVDLSGTSRGGILTQASVLTVTSYPNRTSPVLRGKWILENILNAPPPAPPPGVPNLNVSNVGASASLRQQLEEHRKNPTCASCHARMDPLGFGLENFDAVGAWRTADGKVPIDSSGSLPDGRVFQGPNGIKTILKADRDAFAECLTVKLLTYALGRGLERYDRPAVISITKRVAADDYRFSRLVLEIVNSAPFRQRRAMTAPPSPESARPPERTPAGKDARKGTVTP